MRRVLIVVSMTAAVALFAAPAASAGGSLIHVREVQGTGGKEQAHETAWAAPGATVTMQGVFGPGSQGDVSEGPWHAYLGAFDAPRHARPVPLADVEIAQATGNICCWAASVTFVVPEVPFGMYWVGVCSDARCRHGVGDLVGGGLAVASTSLEARLLEEAESYGPVVAERDRLSARVGTLRGELGTVSGERAQAESRLGDAVGERDAAREERSLLASEVDALRSEVALLRIALIALSAVLLAVVALIVRGRRRAVRIPDSPAELLEPAEALR